MWRPHSAVVPKKQTKGTKSADFRMWQGGWGKKSETFADVIYGSPSVGAFTCKYTHSHVRQQRRPIFIDHTHSCLQLQTTFPCTDPSQYGETFWVNIWIESTAPLIFLCVARRLQPQNRVSSRHNFQLGRALSTMDYSAHRILWLSNIVTCNDVLLVETIFIAIGNILS